MFADLINCLLWTVCCHFAPQSIKKFEGETLTEDTLLEVWRRYDLDGSGHLDRDELYAVS
jgi:Ca2+-binding EF-hand superfamily protein